MYMMLHWTIQTTSIVFATVCNIVSVICLTMVLMEGAPLDCQEESSGTWACCQQFLPLSCVDFYHGYTWSLSRVKFSELETPWTIPHTAGTDIHLNVGKDDPRPSQLGILITSIQWSSKLSARSTSTDFITSWATDLVKYDFVIWISCSYCFIVLV